MTLAHELTPQLKRLRLSGVLDSLDVRTQQAITEKWSYVDFLGRLVQDEVERRAAKQLALRLRRGQANPTKTLASFDFDFNPGLNRHQVFDLATCAYLRGHRNCLIVGQTGVGKSHLAQALLLEAARQGFDVLFTNTHKMLQHLAASRADGSFERRLAVYLKPDLLVLDDFALRPLPATTGAGDIYDVINERHDRKSILVTSNRAPAEWQELFSDPLLGNATLDRLADRAYVLAIKGKSFRTTQAQTYEEAPANETP